MRIRNDFIKAIREDLLGPKLGPEEIVGFRPNEEYIVGSLIPRAARTRYGQTIEGIEARPLDHDEERDLTGESDWVEDTDSQGLLLDPRFRIKSFGISFEALSPDNPRVHICLTWARYTLHREAGNGRMYKRTPFCTVLMDQQLPIGTVDLFSDDGVMVRAFVRRLDPNQGAYHVTIYFINDTEISDDERSVPVEKMIFQPQMRVSMADGCEVQPIYIKNVSGEDGQFSLLYRNRQAFARGHSCAAIWEGIDPEIEKGVELGEEDNNPFYWIDIDCAKTVHDPKEVERIFFPPHIRTEFLPPVLVEQVTMGPSPEFHRQAGHEPSKGIAASSLAESVNEKELLEHLNPLLEEYELWIDWTKQQAHTLQSGLQHQAQDNIQNAEYSLSRMREGLRTLRNDAHAKLAFCFMNQAMELQRVWLNKLSGNSSHRGLTWYPFQIAFILQSIPEIVNPSSFPNERKICDLLWFPTGGGKTEAYLGLAAFVMAFRRLSSNMQNMGTAVLSRYTLRLLTIQQFRRALTLITACELLRARKWTPRGYPEESVDWGTIRFSVGLWVGNTVTPGRTRDAIRALRRPHEYIVADPAQVIACPCCGSILSITQSNLDSSGSEIRWLVRLAGAPPSKLQVGSLSNNRINVQSVNLHDLGNEYHILGIRFGFRGETPSAMEIQEWWRTRVEPHIGPLDLVSASPNRPGYFIRECGAFGTEVEFEIRCLDPDCELNTVEWSESFPYQDGMESPEQHPAFCDSATPEISKGMPIPAYTVDQQIYHRLPTLIVATVDKFARLPYEPRSAAIFGNIDRFDPCWGYYRRQVPPYRGSDARFIELTAHRFLPPNLIIQDELHLIDGPLGSLMGLYETVIDELTRQGDAPAKYVASSATVRRAPDQVRAVFDRQLAIFPPAGIDIADNYFSHISPEHPADARNRGRIYIGVCASGTSAQTMTMRIWGVFLHQAHLEMLSHGASNRFVDDYWTCVGYFNAIRELASARSVYRQDIPARLRELAARSGVPLRELPPTSLMELSSNVNSSEIPGRLSHLERGCPSNVDALLTTSMFGVGVDIDRLGLMIVHGQPKATSSYIQATGRVGRARPGLVVTFYRSGRPRDLAHYEFFTGYHRALLSYTEPISVFPMSSGARERAIGPVAVAILRNAHLIRGINVSPQWALERLGTQPRSGSVTMATNRNAREVLGLGDLLEDRASSQPAMRRPQAGVVQQEANNSMDRWEQLARRRPDLFYWEETLSRPASRPVVLGSPNHQVARIDVVFTNAPQSLRDVESITRFGL